MGIGDEFKVSAFIQHENVLYRFSDDTLSETSRGHGTIVVEGHTLQGVRAVPERGREGGRPCSLDEEGLPQVRALMKVEELSTSESFGWFWDLESNLVLIPRAGGVGQYRLHHFGIRCPPCGFTRKPLKSSNNCCHHVVTIVVILARLGVLGARFRHMKSFDRQTLPTLPLTHDLLRSVGTIHEHCGREQLCA